MGEDGNYPNQLADLAPWAGKSCRGCFVSLTSAGAGRFAGEGFSGKPERLYFWMLVEMDG